MHPHLLAVHRLFLAEQQAFRKAHRLIDLFESIIKTYTVVIMSEYVRHNRLSEAAKGLLSQGLRTPSLGIWVLFGRELYKELGGTEFTWTPEGFAKAFEELDNALSQQKTDAVALRNKYAHGATPNDEDCLADIRQFEPFAHRLLKAHWLLSSTLKVRENSVFLLEGDRSLSLHPLLLYRSDQGDSEFAFFNDLKNDRINLINYPLSKYYREKEFWEEFHRHLPLTEWKATATNEFNQRIEELTETFKGRAAERKQMLEFVTGRHKGYFSIQGNPGIGKSALIAQFFKDLKPHLKKNKLLVIEYFIKRGTTQAGPDFMLSYLIKRTDAVFSEGREIRAEGSTNLDVQQQLFTKWRMWSQHHKGRKLIYLIDGLDEGVENNLLSYLPRENFEQVLFLYGSRPGGHQSIDDLWGTLPSEYHTRCELQGLGKEDIRALIYEVANKYEVERESAWIEAVMQKSQGNPLYLKLLCNALENGSIVLNDIGALPAEIYDYYKAILQRYAYDPRDGHALLSGLYTFAAARDYLSMAHLRLMNGMDHAALQRVGSTLKEVLYENPLTDHVLDYQLFHESFREFLLQQKSMEVRDAAERILDFCGKWRDWEGVWEQRYALEHYAAHLSDSRKAARSEELMQLLRDESYVLTQKKVLQNYKATSLLLRACLLKAGELQRWEDQLEAALGLVDLRYEEANDAPLVVAMVGRGEIDAALRRIEAFGGSDKEGIRRKFTLYMLCLMELTLLGGKDKPFRKTAIDSLLRHLDENLPTDFSVLKWNDFFPSYLMFQVASECAALGVDYGVLYKRTDDWETDWIAEKGPYTDQQFRVLRECGRGISDEEKKGRGLLSIAVELNKQGYVEESASVMQESLSIARSTGNYYMKSMALMDIAVELSKRGQVEESLAIARSISDVSIRSNAFKDIAVELSKRGQVEEAASLLQESLIIARGISTDFRKSRALMDIAVDLSKQGQVEESASVMQESLAIVRGISDEYYGLRVMSEIAVELSKQGQVEESLAIARGISDESEKGRALSTIAVELCKQGQMEESAKVMQESLAIARGLSNEVRKSSLLIKIAEVLSKQGQLDELLAIARGISDESEKSRALTAIAVELSKQGQVEESASVMQQSLVITRGISDKSRTLMYFVLELSNMVQLEESLAIAARGISDESEKSSALTAIAVVLSNQGQMEESASVMQESLAIARGISNESKKSQVLSKIAVELSNLGQLEESASVMQESLAIARGISNESGKCSLLIKIAEVLNKQGQLDEFLAIARGISDESEKSRALTAIAAELFKQGQVGESASVMQESLAIASGLNDEYYKSRVMKYIAVELSQQGQVEESLAIARGISGDYWKSSAMSVIAVEMSKQGQVEESLAIASSISGEYWKSSAMSDVAVELSQQGQVEESLDIARGISEEYNRYRALKDIAVELSKQGNWTMAESVLLEVSRAGKRHEGWQEMAKAEVETEGWQKALRQAMNFQGEEARLFYCKGWSQKVGITDVDDACVRGALPILGDYPESIESLLEKYAIRLVSMGTPSKALEGRLNRTLNIQWLLDIIANKPNSATHDRLSTNLEEWLHEIPEEDDREQITLWARRVAKGRLTESEFAERLKDINSNQT